MFIKGHQVLHRLFGKRRQLSLEGHSAENKTQSTVWDGFSKDSNAPTIGHRHSSSRGWFGHWVLEHSLLLAIPIVIGLIDCKNGHQFFSPVFIHPCSLAMEFWKPYHLILDSAMWYQETWHKQKFEKHVYSTTCLLLKPWGYHMKKPKLVSWMMRYT